MSHLLAITTRDGKMVQEHFGHARHFHIVHVTDDGYEYLETRELEPLCNDDFPGESSHSAARFAPVLELLKDCEAVVTAQIGPGAAAQVIGGGLRIFEGRGFVSDILDEIVANRLLSG